MLSEMLLLTNVIHKLISFDSGDDKLFKSVFLCIPVTVLVVYLNLATPEQKEDDVNLV